MPGLKIVNSALANPDVAGLYSQARRMRSHCRTTARRGIRKYDSEIGYAVLAVLAIASLARADSATFSFSGGGITSSGTLTFVSAPDGTSGVSTPGTYEITGITGTFTDMNDGVSGVDYWAVQIRFLTPLGKLRDQHSRVRGFPTTTCSLPGRIHRPTVRVTRLRAVAILTYTEWRSVFLMETSVSSSAMESCREIQARCTQRLMPAQPSY